MAKCLKCKECMERFWTEQGGLVFYCPICFKFYKILPKGKLEEIEPVEDYKKYLK